MSHCVTVAAVQSTPVFLDRGATVERLVADIAEAGRRGAGLVVFPEAVVPGYPDSVWRSPAWADSGWYSWLFDQAVSVPSETTDRLGTAAAAVSAWVVVGVTERTRSWTLYNTLVYLAPDGRLAGVHRKLMPTGGERTVWGYGDGSSLTVVEAPYGRIGGLIPYGGWSVKRFG